MWVHNVQYLAGNISFGQLEKLFWRSTHPGEAMPERLPDAWYRYAKGVHGLTPPGESDSQVDWANGANQYPGSAAIYNAFIWDLLKVYYEEGPEQLAILDYGERCNAAVRNKIKSNPNSFMPLGYFPSLSFTGCDIAVKTPHIDALGLLLLQVCKLDPWYYAEMNVLAVRNWLKRWAYELPYLAPVRERLFTMLEMQVPRLGDLTGKRGINPAKSQKKDRADVSANESTFQKNAHRELRETYSEEEIKVLYDGDFLIKEGIIIG